MLTRCPVKSGGGLCVFHPVSVRITGRLCSFNVSVAYDSRRAKYWYYFQEDECLIYFQGNVVKHPLLDITFLTIPNLA